MLLISIKIISEVDMEILWCISPIKKERQNALSSIDNKTIAANFPCGQQGTECITISQVDRR